MDAARQFADLDAVPATTKIAKHIETTYHIWKCTTSRCQVPGTAVAVEHAIRVSMASGIASARSGSGYHVPPNLTAHIGVSAHRMETPIPVR